MTQVVEAIYSHGVLRPLSPLQIPDEQKVQLVVTVASEQASPDKAAALMRLMEGIENSTVRLTGPLPSREELHERD